MPGLRDDDQFVRRPFLISSWSALFCFLYLNFIGFVGSLILIPIFLLLSIFFLFVFKNKLFLLFCISCLISSGMFAFKFYNKDKIINSIQEKELTIIGYPTDFPTYSNGICKYDIKVESIEGLENIPKFNIEMLTSDDIYCDVFQKFKIKLKRLDNNNFSDYINLKSQGKSFSSFAYLYKGIERFETNKNIRYYILKTREFLINQVTKIFDSRSERLIRALIFRDRSKLSYEEKNAFSDSGVFHFLAVSGFHFCLMCNILINFLKLINLNKKVIYIIACIFIVFYMLIIGFTPSVVRSGIMLFIHFLGKIFFKKDDSLNSLSLALIFILFFNQDSCLDIGLWMSFISSVSLICFSDKLKKIIRSKIEYKSRILNYFISNFSDSIIGTFSVLPISCLYFKNISLIFVISNLFVKIQSRFYSGSNYISYSS